MNCTLKKWFKWSILCYVCFTAIFKKESVLATLSTCLWAMITCSGWVSLSLAGTTPFAKLDALSPRGGFKYSDEQSLHSEHSHLLMWLSDFTRSCATQATTVWQRTGRDKEKLDISVRMSSSCCLKCLEEPLEAPSPLQGGRVSSVRSAPSQRGWLHLCSACGLQKREAAAPKPHHSICIWSPCLERLKREVLSL